MKTISAQSDVAVLTSDQSGKVVEDYEQPRFTQRETLLTMLGVLMVIHWIKQLSQQLCHQLLLIYTDSIVIPGFQLRTYSHLP